MRGQNSAIKPAAAWIPEPAADRLEATRRFWEARMEKQLTREEVRQIVENFTGFFALLAQWDATTGPQR
jgi:hypothetical protein